MRGQKIAQLVFHVRVEVERKWVAPIEHVGQKQREYLGKSNTVGIVGALRGIEQERNRPGNALPRELEQGAAILPHAERVLHHIEVEEELLRPVIARCADGRVATDPVEVEHLLSERNRLRQGERDELKSMIFPERQLAVEAQVVAAQEIGAIHLVAHKRDASPLVEQRVDTRVIHLVTAREGAIRPRERRERLPAENDDVGAFPLGGRNEHFACPFRDVVVRVYEQDEVALRELDSDVARMGYAGILAMRDMEA